MFSRRLWLPLAVAAMCLFVAAPASAQVTISNQPVYLTFANPVALPGMTVPAGEYEFRVASMKGDRNVIEVYNRQDGKRVGTFLAYPRHLTDTQPVPEKPEVTFYETPANTPDAVKSWFYPGIHDGHEFIYPIEQARELAKLNEGGVLTANGEVESGELTRLGPSGEMSAENEPAAQAAADNNAAPARPAPQPRAQADASMNASNAAAQAGPADGNMSNRPEPVGQMAASRTALPQTAGDRYLVAAAGVLSVLAGFVLMGRRRLA